MTAKTIQTAGLLVSCLLAAAPALAQDVLRTQGRTVFNRWCVQCHGQGAEMPGTNALAAKYRSAVPALLEERVDLTPEVVRQFVRHGVSIMPTFRKTEISDRELAALGAYLDRGRKP